MDAVTVSASSSLASFLYGTTAGVLTESMFPHASEAENSPGRETVEIAAQVAALGVGYTVGSLVLVNTLGVDENVGAAFYAMGLSFAVPSLRTKVSRLVKNLGLAIESVPSTAAVKSRLSGPSDES